MENKEWVTVEDYLKMVNPGHVFKSASKIKQQSKELQPKVKYNDGNYTGDLLDKVSVKDEGARVEYFNDHIRVTRRNGKKFRIIIQVEA